MKRLTLFLSIGLFLIIVQNVSAQPKKLLVFKSGAAIVNGTVKGTETKTFYFKVKKNTDMEIFIDETEEANRRPKFTLFKPNGKLFYDDDSVNRGDAYDLMDVLEDAGIYKIVVQLPEKLQTIEKPVKFTLRLILR